MIMCKMLIFRGVKVQDPTQASQGANSPHQCIQCNFPSHLAVFWFVSVNKNWLKLYCVFSHILPSKPRLEHGNATDGVGQGGHGDLPWSSSHGVCTSWFLSFFWISTHFVFSIWATDEITCLWKMPSPNVGGLLSVLQVFNMDYGVSVLGGLLLVMKVRWAASKFKATSCYSVHPLILSTTRMLSSVLFDPFSRIPMAVVFFFILGAVFLLRSTYFCSVDVSRTVTWILNIAGWSNICWLTLFPSTQRLAKKLQLRCTKLYRFNQWVAVLLPRQFQGNVTWSSPCKWP